MQKFLAIGNIGSVQPIKQVGDSEVLNFSVAVNNYAGKDSTGKSVYKTMWVSCSVWGALAKAMQWLEKGMKVYVSGELDFDEKGNPKTYATKDGEVRASFSLTVREIEVVSSANAPAEVEDEDDDMPF